MILRVAFRVSPAPALMRTVLRPTCIKRLVSASPLLDSCRIRSISCVAEPVLSARNANACMTRGLLQAAAPRQRLFLGTDLMSSFSSTTRAFQVPRNAGTNGTSGSRHRSAGGGSSGAGAGQETLHDRNMRVAMYATAVAIGIVGLSYAAVPLYQIFCQATGYGGTTQQASEEQFKTMRPVPGAKPITVNFNADTSSSMPWTFVPQQRSVKVVPGETALAFYTAHNPSDAAVTGVSTYNVTPMRAGLYFHKIQCFCFEEQRLRPHEEIDMPIFFYIDPAILDDPVLHNMRSLTLSYTFFRTGEAEVLDIANEYQKREAGAALARNRLAAIKAGGEDGAAGAADGAALTEAAPGAAVAAAAAGSIASAVNAQPRPAAAGAAARGATDGVASLEAQEALRAWTEAAAARTAKQAETAAAAAAPSKPAA